MTEKSFHPENIHKRIAYVDMKEIKEDGSEYPPDESHARATTRTPECNQVVRYNRSIYSRVPEHDCVINDLVVFDYPGKNLTYTPFIPESEKNNDHYFPFTYPGIIRYGIWFEETETGPFISMRAVYFTSRWNVQHVLNIMKAQIEVLQKWGKREDEGGYDKRVYHDIIIPQTMYYNKYHELKAKYRFWTKQWDEKTDPSKYVFEETGIAAFLICLFDLESERTQDHRKPTFVDMGCGNGFLTYILTSEGYKGKGVDVAERSIWKEYQKFGVEPQLQVEAVNPDQLEFPDTDWILGNHADELTPWIPIIAAKSNANYFVLPCCMFDFEKKWQGRKLPGRGRYDVYLEYIQHIGATCGYQVEIECLRIPSTKNYAHIGRTRTKDRDASLMDIKAMLEKAGYQGTFVPRKTDREMHLIRRQKEETKKAKKPPKERDPVIEAKIREAREKKRKAKEDLEASKIRGKESKEEVVPS
eukprot:TRINITY_DN15413_c0_g1_i1.p1 TRINITY_DN15413_c0_g1~~TRINITY_DN15413_c0_g1_i1.p1  ORF type:complete len:498 (-),score=132.46 TRINITY_DN15413_c0_g1_i1:3-1418(-)